MFFLILNDPQQNCQCLVKVDPNQRLKVGLGGIFGKAVLKDGEKIPEVLEFIGLLIESADEYKNGVLDDRQC